HFTEPFMVLQLIPEPFLRGMFGLIRLFRRNSRHLAKIHHEKSAGPMALGTRNRAGATRRNPFCPGSQTSEMLGPVNEAPWSLAIFNAIQGRWVHKNEPTTHITSVSLNLQGRNQLPSRAKILNDSKFCCGFIACPEVHNRLSGSRL